MVKFIDEHREVYGVEPICAVLPIAPSTYYKCAREAQHPELRSERAKSDERWGEEIKRVWDASNGVYGGRKVWRQLLRENKKLARCTLERLMRQNGLSGAVRRRSVRTTTPAADVEHPSDLVNRHFVAQAPNVLWVADITYVRTRTGFAYVSFVTDVYSRRIVGWSVSTTLQTDLTLRAIEQAIVERDAGHGLVHHSDRGSQYLAFRYTERLKQAGIQSSVGSVGDSYDNALAETINGLYKTEVIWRKPSWANAKDVELATLTWVHWFNHERLLEPLGYIPPAEFEEEYYQRQAAQHDVV